MLASAVALALFGSPFVSSTLLDSLESRYPVIAPALTPRTDAIVVLGGITRSTQSYPAERFDLSDQAERIDEGARLFHAGVAPVLVLTSGGIVPANPAVEGDHLRQLLLTNYRIPGESIVHTGKLSRNTAEEAVNVGELARAQGWTTITLVTSAYHMPRAVLLFRRASMQVNPHPVDFRAFRDPQEPAGNRWFPRADFLNQTEIGMREYYGIAFYKLFGK
jgi:uncharacterized SAM-binding protein YcdF (DUF218 family)